MEARHEMTAHIRKNRTVFFQIGMLFGLLLVFGAFRWTIYGENTALPESEVNRPAEDTQIGEIKLEQEKPEEQLKEKSNNSNSDQFKIVDDKYKITDTVSQKNDSSQVSFTTGVITAALKDTTPEVIKGDDDNNIRPWTEVKPMFPGGDAAMQKFIRDNYVVPYDLTISGESIVFVQVKCVVEKDGSLSNISVVKDGGHPDAGIAAIRVVERMPRWTPGYQGARPARVWLSIPIKIRLN